MISKYLKGLIFLFLLLPTLGYAENLKLTWQINGVNNDVLENITTSLNVLQRNTAKTLTENNIHVLFQQAPQNIREAMKPYGYFNPSVHGNLSVRHNHWLATFNIQPGSAVRISQVNISITGPGKDEIPFQKYLHNFPIQVGQPLSIPKYNSVKQNFYDIAQFLGYLDGTLTVHQIQINLAKKTAIINLQFNTGHRYYFGNVSFSQTPYQESFLQRYVPFRPGEPFSNIKLQKLQTNLSRSVYFEHVGIENDRNNNQYFVPIKVSLTPRKANQYSIGAGYGTDTGVRGSFGWEWRRASDTGNYFQTIVQASQIQNNFQTRYIIPGPNPVTDSYNIGGGVFNNNIPEGNYRTWKFGGAYSKKLRKWTRILSLNFQHEDYTLFQQTNHTNYIVGGISFERIHTKNRINTNNGYRIYAHLRGGDSVNENNPFVQGEIQAKLIKTFWQNNRIILNSDLGATAVNDINNFPLSLQFLAGGAQSVRGFDYQSLGPGKYLIVGSAEYQRRIYKAIYGALFFDTGNAFNNFNTGLQKSTGIGLVWRSPIGPIEVSVAKPVTQNTNPFWSKKGLRVQFVMGPDL